MSIDIRKLHQSSTELESYRTSLHLRVGKVEKLKEQLLVLEQALQLFSSCRDVWTDGKHIIDDSSDFTPKEKYQQLLSQLMDISSSLPNVYRHIDAETKNQETLDTSPHNHSSNTKLDVMFAIGGYEELGSHGVFYTDIGIALIDSMHQFILKWWTKQSTFEHATSFRQWKLPAILNNKPSWQVILEENHSHQKYFDRQLPIFYSLQCDDGSAGAVVSGENQLASESRAKRNWYQRKSTAWQIVVLTGPSYEVDVKPLQQKLMSNISAFYQSLGLAPHCNVVDPTKLLPHQANRIDWILEDKILASLANYDQFFSTAGKHSHSGERLCVLHGTLCHVPGTLESLLQQGWKGSSTVSVPRFLHTKPIPVIRHRVRKKNGQWMVQSFPPKPMTPTPHDIRMEAASCPFDFLPFYYK